MKTSKVTKKSNIVAYDNARKQGIIDDICAHMKIKRHIWTDETAILEAKKYKNRNEMQNIVIQLLYTYIVTIL